MSRSHVAHRFDRSELARICAMSEGRFGAAFDMDKVVIPESVYVRKPENFYFHKDNGSDILAVAHLDTVVGRTGRTARFLDTDAGPVVFSGALDDRLGAYIILDLLPKLGITCDVLLTVGEESGSSTAQFFQASKKYNWMIEFDRGGTDVVMYQYDDDEARDLVRDSGAKVGNGIFSDICFLDHLGIKGFNWGVGYQEYHGPRSHAFLNDTFDMVAHFLRFYAANAETVMPYVDIADVGFLDHEGDPYQDDMADVQDDELSGPAPASWWQGLRGLGSYVDPDEPDAKVSPASGRVDGDEQKAVNA